MANNGDGPDEFSARANQTNREFRAFAYANSIVERTEGLSWLRQNGTSTLYSLHSSHFDHLYRSLPDER
jgi:hypothetical protein